MNPRRCNRTLLFTIIIMGVIGAIIVSNVLFTMVTSKHLRSDVNVKQFKAADASDVRVIKANRGVIYDRDGEVIAQDEDTYTLVAFLDKSRKGIGNKPAYVSDLRKTARLLAPILNTSEEDLYTTLKEANDAGKYQTEFSSGKNLTNSVKESIEILGLQGIEFTKSVKRNYPNGTFASHLIGYAQYEEKKSTLIGKMGLESTLNRYLTGIDGKEVYQKDVDGNQLPGTLYTKKYSKNGNNVTLTLDRNVQLTLQSSLKKTVEQSGKLGWGVVMEVETGKILGYASYPSFDLNNRDDLKDYTDVPANFMYEPGSTLKGITYSAAIDSGNYPYGQSFVSNVFYYGVDAAGKIYRSNTAVPGLSPIYDALGKENGSMDFDKGFVKSSNIGICELLTNYMNPDIYREYIDKFGFLKSVAIPFVSNGAGSIGWQYASDKLSAGFGQGITINALQMAQAYTAILNDGEMVRPYVVDRIEDADSHKIIKQYDTKQVGKPISKETSEYMRGLMQRVVEDSDGSGHAYQMNDVKVIAKTGTGQVAGQNGYDGSLYTNSVMMAAPAEDPKVMVYYCFSGSDILNYDRNPMKEVMRSALVATNITGTETTNGEPKTYNEWKEYKMPSLVNHTLAYSEQKLKDITVGNVVIGNGTSIVKQYPAEHATIVSNQNIFLLTDGAQITMPDMIGWTKKDITAFWELAGIQVQMEGTGAVVSQDIPTGQTIDKNTMIKVVMK